MQSTLSQPSIKEVYGSGSKDPNGDLQEKEADSLTTSYRVQLEKNANNSV